MRKAARPVPQAVRVAQQDWQAALRDRRMVRRLMLAALQTARAARQRWPAARRGWLAVQWPMRAAQRLARLLVLLTVHMARRNWRAALPALAAS
jgi:hypothetical protein